MSERHWSFGTVVRVDPEQNTTVPQPDHRRWMIVATASTFGLTPWKMIFLGPGKLSGETSNWTGLTGFTRVDDEDV